jgi:ubiquinone/menaquinone biosynthesis C-methylase UbiE
LTGSDDNRDVFDSVADSYTELALMPAEREAMGRLSGSLHEFEMLDIGVGAGRTAYTFAPLVRRYVGVDYSPRMVERARKLIGEDDRVTFVLGDARDLSSLGGTFDFVLFSFNGIDAVGHADRLKILAEVRRVIKPGGYFLFSTHSIGALPLTTRRSPSQRLAGSRIYDLYARLAQFSYARRVRKVNRTLDLKDAQERGWTVVQKFAHNFKVDDYYVDPTYQAVQLREAGFELETVYDVAGREVQLPYGGRDPWLDYLCRPAGA